MKSRAGINSAAWMLIRDLQKEQRQKGLHCEVWSDLCGLIHSGEARGVEGAAATGDPKCAGTRKQYDVSIRGPGPLQLAREWKRLEHQRLASEVSSAASAVPRRKCSDHHVREVAAAADGSNIVRDGAGARWLDWCQGRAGL